MVCGERRLRLIMPVAALLLILSFTPWGRTVAQENCDYLFRDCNRNGIANELTDIVTMIAYYRGSIIPGYTCNCPPHDWLFMPDADPDGDCVPFEISDIVAILGPPPDWPPYDGCPDCPGGDLRQESNQGADTLSNPESSSSE
jgi:hypothetical protein